MSKTGCASLVALLTMCLSAVPVAAQPLPATRQQPPRIEAQPPQFQNQPPQAQPPQAQPPQNQPLPPGQSPYTKPDPAYAKWGKLAVMEAKRCYPNATVVDYKYVGQKPLGQNRAEETFRFWMREGTREFGVIVRLEIQVNPERLIEADCDRIGQPD